MTLVSLWLISPQNSKGKIGSGDTNKRGVGKIRNFQPISPISQKRCKIGQRLLLMTNMRFRLVPKSMTLDDLERPPNFGHSGWPHGLPMPGFASAPVNSGKT